MSAEKKRIDPVTWVFLIVLLGLAVLMGWQEATGGILEEGSLAPEFTLERLQGPPVSLSSLRGQVVVVNFWATWCPPCRDEMPYLLSVVKEHEARGVTLIAVSNDDRDNQRSAVARFLRMLPALEPYVALGRPEVGAAWEVRALPSVYVLDRAGRVVASQQGQATEGQLRRWIGEALEAP